MKKIIITTLIILLMPFKTSALEIEKIYMDAEIEIGGGLNVKTLIKVSNNNEPLKYNIYLKDKSLKEFTGKQEDFEESLIYNATFAKLTKAGELKDEEYFNKLYESDFEKNVTFFEELKEEEQEKDDLKYHIITLNSDKNETIYYLEYKVMNVLVEHTDSAEFYYKLFKNFNYDIKEIKILTHLPSKSELFKVWAHGNRDWKVNKDVGNQKVLLEKENFKKDEQIELRILYDKDIFAVNINLDKKTNMEALPIITKIEDARLKNTNTQNLLKHSLVVLSTLLIVSIIAFVINKIIKKIKKTQKVKQKV